MELNPVRAWLVARPETYPWSSAGAHLEGGDDALVKVSPLVEIVWDRLAFLGQGVREGVIQTIYGRPPLPPHSFS